MTGAARHAVLVLDLPDRATELKARTTRIAALGGPDEYAKQYEGLEHQYYDRKECEPSSLPAAVRPWTRITSGFQDTRTLPSVRPLGLQGLDAVVKITAFRLRRLAVARFASSIASIRLAQPRLVDRFATDLRYLNDTLAETELQGHYWVWGGLLLGLGARWRRSSARLPGRGLRCGRR